MVKQNPSVVYQWCFLEVYVENASVKVLSFFLRFVSSYTIKYYFFKGIYFIKHRVFLTCNNYYVTDDHFIKSYSLKPITELSFSL